MLTTALVRARVRGKEVVPAFLDPGSPHAEELAGSVYSCWSDGAAEGARVGEVETEIDALCALATDGKLLRGLSKLCADRVTTGEPPIEAKALRAAAFRRAAEIGPLATRPGTPGRPTADMVLAELAGATPFTVDDLYGDLPAEQRILSFGVPDARWLVDRYNVALCQAILLQASEVVLTLPSPSAPRLRQLFRWAKFHQLLCTAHRTGEELEVRFDGPSSLLASSTRYGLQLARFLPAVLLQSGEWTLQATVTWTRRRLRRSFVLRATDGLRSHWKDTGAWRGKTHAALVAAFQGSPSGWTLSDGTLPVQIGPKELFFPDFALSDGRATIRLEVLGYWRRDHVARRLAAMDRYGCNDVLLAVSRRLCADRGPDAPEDPRVIVYSDVLPVGRVTAAATALRDGR